MVVNCVCLRFELKWSVARCQSVYHVTAASLFCDVFCTVLYACSMPRTCWWISLVSTLKLHVLSFYSMNRLSQFFLVSWLGSMCSTLTFSKSKACFWIAACLASVGGKFSGHLEAFARFSSFLCCWALCDAVKSVSPMYLIGQALPSSPPEQFIW